MINHETEIRKLFAQSKNIALMGHINPDGDCI
jgi:nanoRNase/pAp phosphatase (c-di-AMP/oligoRNAs hydrolase)